MQKTKPNKQKQDISIIYRQSFKIHIGWPLEVACWIYLKRTGNFLFDLC